MSTALTLIDSAILSSNTASVTFSSIPQNFEDLMVKFTWRSTANGSGAGLQINSDTGSNYSYRGMRAYGTTVESFNSATWTSSYGTAYDEFIFWGVRTAAFTSNTFANGHIYIPDYAGSLKKVVSIDTYPESNDSSVTTPYNISGTWNNTSAINSLKFMVDPYASGSPIIAANSSFYLYGITKAA